MLLSDEIARFLKLKEAQGRSTATVTWYRNVLNALVIAMGNKPVSQVSNDEMVTLIVAVRRRMSRAGADSYIRGFKAFWVWCAQRHKIDEPMREIKFPKPSPPVPQAMLIDEFRTLYANAPTRERAMLTLFLATGIRASELANLTWRDVDMDRNRITVTGKGRKRRVVGFDQLTHDCLSLWRTAQPETVSVFGLSYTGVYQALKRLAKKVGVEKFNPHSMRHLYGKLKSLAGENSILIARQMGHEDVNVTARTYTQLNDTELDGLHSPIDDAI